MKIEDFTLETQTDDKGESVLWIVGSKSDSRGIGSLGGKRYQVKVHQQRPIWKNNAQKTSKLEADLRACGADETDKRKDLQNQIDSLKSVKKQHDKYDKEADDYVAIKRNLVKSLKAIGDPLIVGPCDFWKQEVDFKGNAECAVEAAPWFENVAVWFSPDKPLVFNRDFDKAQQYKIIAELAERVAVLHSHGIIHGDLKIGNTLITKVGSEFKVALIDFDGAIVLDDLYHADKYDFGAWQYIVGGTYYSPEMHLFNKYVKDKDNEDFSDIDVKEVNEKSDIFALGVTIYEYLYGEGNIPSMLSSTGEAEISSEFGKKMINGSILDLDASVDDFLYGMINWMMAFKASDRPTAAQVKDAFLSQDIKMIPSQYVRNPLWEEHRDDYEALPILGVVIQRTKNGKYLLKRDGNVLPCDIKRLVEQKVVKRITDEPEPEAKGPVDTDKLWPSDGTGDLPACTRRASSDGRYMLMTGGITKGVSYRDLVNAGVICSDAELATPWPCDKGLRFISSKSITRDLGAKKGPGYYVVGAGVTAMRYTTKQLVDNGHASFGVSFALHINDAELYVPAPENVPPAVTNILRGTMNHQYRIIYNDGRVDKLMIADMLAKGYVKKK